MTERDNADDGAPALARVWLSPDEVQQRTGLGRTLIYEALQTGALEGFQLGKGRKWRVHVEKVDAWITGQSKQSERKSA